MPLRPELYKRLVHRFRHVQIASEGQEMVSSLQTSARTGKKTRDVLSPGEYYRVNCPFCQDLRHRLWINHQWGYLDPDTDSKQLRLAICFNENCLADPHNRNWLFADVFNDFCSNDDVVLPGKRPATGTPRECVWPGELRYMHQLPAEHAANVYLRDRGFEPDHLGRELKVSCLIAPEPQFDYVAGRIVIPIYMNGKPMGWQARHVGSLTREEQKFRAKYLSMPGMRKTEVLYNYDRAKLHQAVCICEGPTDVWRVGPSAVALFGKNMSETQKQLIASTWGHGTVIVLLDGDAGEAGQKVYDALGGLVQRRVLVKLPDGKDPGDCTREELQAAIAGAMQSLMPAALSLN